MQLPWFSLRESSLVWWSHQCLNCWQYASTTRFFKSQTQTKIMKTRVWVKTKLTKMKKWKKRKKDEKANSCELDTSDLWGHLRSWLLREAYRSNYFNHAILKKIPLNYVEATDEPYILWLRPCWSLLRLIWYQINKGGKFLTKLWCCVGGGV